MYKRKETSESRAKKCLICAIKKYTENGQEISKLKRNVCEVYKINQAKISLPNAKRKETQQRFFAQCKMKRNLTMIFLPVQKIIKPGKDFFAQCKKENLGKGGACIVPRLKELGKHL